MVIRTTNELKRYRDQLHGNVGLVPTMGNLHEGHLELIRHSLYDNEFTIVTIFVNPTQFGAGEDFSTYPRTLDVDLRAIKSIEESDDKIVVFAPQRVEEIYPLGFQTKIEVTEITKNLCGASRPGHFAGVTTVVYLLFALTHPTNAYFGEKDFQQLQTIKRMVNDLILPINIVPIPIVRDSDGLAKSSRNSYLSKDERAIGLNLPRSIVELAEIVKVSGVLAGEKKIYDIVTIDKNWEYLLIVDSSTLNQATNESVEVVIAGAYKVGKTRLIDNSRVRVKVKAEVEVPCVR